MAGRLYLLSLTSVSGHVCDYTDNTSVNRGQCQEGEALILNRFKVIGENTLLLVVQETDTNSVENLVRYRLSKQLTVSTCTPLLAYDVFAKAIGVEIPNSRPQILENGKFHWLEFNIDFPGRTVEELLEVWKKEAELAVGSQRSKQINIYKVVGERKVHLFADYPPALVDQMSFRLPLTALGSSVVIKTKALDRF